MPLTEKWNGSRSYQSLNMSWSQNLCCMKGFWAAAQASYSASTEVTAEDLSKKDPEFRSLPPFRPFSEIMMSLGSAEMMSSSLMVRLFMTPSASSTQIQSY